MEYGNSNINEGIKSGKNCTILTGNKQDPLVCKNTSEAASTPTKICNKSLLNQNVPQCMDILNKTVVDPLSGKELLVASKNSNITVIDKTLPHVGKNYLILKLLKEICYLAKILLKFQIILL